MQLTPGQTFGSYRLVEPAEAGGMAEVWRAHDPRLDRYVAIKLLACRYVEQREYLERFRREALAISRLNHPNVLTILDFGEQDGWTYMVSPFVGGGTLARRLGRGPWRIAEALAVLEPLASALDYAHSQGIVHRDVKPSNVLLTEHGRVVLGDFGVARILEPNMALSRPGLIVGTPMYMSPEQARGEPAGPASDVYSFGVIAFRLLTGVPPFTFDRTEAMLRAHISMAPPAPAALNPTLTDRAQAALYRVLAKQPGARYARAADFVAELRVEDAWSDPAPTPRLAYARGGVAVAALPATLLPEPIPPYPVRLSPYPTSATGLTPVPGWNRPSSAAPAPDPRRGGGVKPARHPVGPLCPRPPVALSHGGPGSAAGAATWADRPARPAGRRRPTIVGLAAVGAGILLLSTLVGMATRSGQRVGEEAAATPHATPTIEQAVSIAQPTSTPVPPTPQPSTPTAMPSTATPDPPTPTSVPSTATPSPQPSVSSLPPEAGPARQPAERPVIFAEDFNVPTRGKLDRGSTDPSVYRVGYEGGEYRMEKVDHARDVAWAHVLPPLRADGMISVDARLEGDSADRFLMLECRYHVSTQHHYRLVVSPELGRAILLRVDVAGFTPLATADSPVIRPGSEMNRIALACQGNTLTGYVNGERVVTAQDDTFKTGRWSIGVGNVPGLVGPVDARFDNLVVSTPQ